MAAPGDRGHRNQHGTDLNAVLDENDYPTGCILSKDERKAILQRVQRDDFHGEWNYTIAPYDPQQGTAGRTRTGEGTQKSALAQGFGISRETVYNSFRMAGSASMSRTRAMRGTLFSICSGTCSGFAAKHSKSMTLFSAFFDETMTTRRFCLDAVSRAAVITVTVSVLSGGRLTVNTPVSGRVRLQRDGGIAYGFWESFD